MFFFGDKHKQSQHITNVATDPERRTTKRRNLKGSVVLGIPDRGIICGDMVDIGTGGLSVIVATQLESGQGCRVCFSIRIGRQKLSIDCIGIVANSVCVAQGFRIGMRFIITDVFQQKVIERFLAEEQYGQSAESHDEPEIRLDQPAIVNFPAESYPKTVRISELGKR